MKKNKFKIKKIKIIKSRKKKKDAKPINGRT